MFEQIEAALEDIRNGKMVIVCDDEDRENEGDLVMAADFATKESINFMAKEGRGLICIPVEAAIADRLDLHLQRKMNAKSYDCNFTVSVDATSVTTGISAQERADTIQKIVDPTSRADDFRQPGHVFPLRAQEGGVLVRAGHTEAAVDLAKLAGCRAAGVICEIMHEDGTMARVPQLKEFAKKHGLKMISIKCLIEYRFAKEKLVRKEVEVDIPTGYGEFKLSAYENSVDGNVHLVISKGELTGSPLVRVHSECFTGDVLGSERCDCADQFHKSLEMIEAEGSGALLYMRQEGRGIGLVNKLKAYKLQDEGMDTVEANAALGFGPDLRHYGIGAQILADMGIHEMRLMTNNPKKLVGIQGYGIKVTDRVPIEIEPRKHNKLYLETKKKKLGHLLDFV